MQLRTMEQQRKCIRFHDAVKVYILALVLLALLGNGLAQHHIPYRWGPWGQQSTCSRSCGKGVSYKERTCYRHSESTGMMVKSEFCDGASKQYSTCNTQPCKEHMDYRSQQCSHFNDRIYRGQFLTWRPYRAAGGTFLHENPCSLVCVAKQRPRLIVKFAPSVVDGTPCGNINDNSNICVAGKCVQIGCDNRINSNATEDRCGVCQGNSSTCETIKGFLEKDVVQGFTPLLTIPNGARNVKVVEIQPTKESLLALKGRNGVFYLNGPGEMKYSELRRTFGGTSFTYYNPFREPNGLEKIFVNGQIDVNLTLLARVKTEYESFKIRYEYTVPLGSRMEERLTTIAHANGQTVPFRGLDEILGVPTLARSRTKTKPQSISPTAGGSELPEKANIGFRIVHEKASSVKNTTRGLQQLRTSHLINSAQGSARQQKMQRSGHSMGVRTRFVTSEARDVAITTSKMPMDLAIVTDSDKDNRDDLTTREIPKNSAHSQTQVSTSQSLKKENFNKTLNGSLSSTGLSEKKTKINNTQHFGEGTSERKPSLEVKKVVAAPRLRLRLIDEPVQLGEFSEDLFQGFTETEEDFLGEKPKISKPNLKAGPVKETGYTSAAFRAGFRSPSYIRSQRRNAALGHFSSDRAPRYHWKTNGNSACSATCTDGVATTYAVCYRYDGERVDDAYCDRRKKPTQTRVACKGKPCPARWVAGPWGVCSQSCGQGKSARSVHCWQMMAPGFDSSVLDHKCSHMDKPHSVQMCSSDACGPVWETSEWGACSATCGDGTKTRTVTCSSDLSPCEVSAKPKDKERCMIEECTNRWRVSDWSQCSGPCGRGLKKRTVTCLDEKGALTDNSACQQDIKPVSVASCGHQLNCPAAWVPQEWGKCSSSCGQGTMTRKIVCGDVTNGRFTMRPDTYCARLQRPVRIGSCREAPCNTRWYSTPWSKCSKTCGYHGVRSRDVTCYADNVVGTGCDESSRPHGRERCTLPECPKTDACTDDPTTNCYSVPSAQLCNHWYYKKACCKTCSGR